MMRTMSETKEKIVAGNSLSHNDILALVDAHTYGTATPMNALIKTLQMIYLQVAEGKLIYYMDKYDNKRTISIDTFETFILSTFDAYVLEEIYNGTK